MTISVIHSFSGESTVVSDLRDGDVVLWLQRATWHSVYADEYVLTVDGDPPTVSLDNYDSLPVGDPLSVQFKFVAKKLALAVDGEHSLEFSATINMTGATLEHGYVLRGVSSVGEGSNSYLGVSTAEPVAWPWICDPADYDSSDMYGFVSSNGTQPVDGTEIHSELGYTIINTGVIQEPVTFTAPSESGGNVFLMLFGGDAPLPLPPTCEGVDASIESGVISGTGTGTNADTWEVRDDADNVMDAGVGNDASFSFEGEHGDYVIEFFNDYGSDSCSFTLNEEPPVLLPVCLGVSASIIQSTSIVTGTGTGENATSWTVTSVLGVILMASGTGNSASFSFVGGYEEYNLTFTNEYGSDFCTFDFDFPPPGPPPTPPPPWEPTTGILPNEPPMKPKSPAEVGGRPPVTGIRPTAPITAPTADPPWGDMPPGEGGSGGRSGNGALGVKPNVKQALDYTPAVYDPATRDYIRSSIESAMKGVAARTKDLQAQIKGLRREEPNIVATRSHTKLPPAVPGAIAFAMDQKAWYSCDDRRMWGRVEYDATTVGGASVDEAFYDVIKSMLVEGENISIAFDDGAMTIEISSSAQAMPTPTADGQILISSGGSFVPATPLVSQTGDWLFDVNGDLIVTR